MDEDDFDLIVAAACLTVKSYAGDGFGLKNGYKPAT